MRLVGSLVPVPVPVPLPAVPVRHRFHVAAVPRLLPRPTCSGVLVAAVLFTCWVVCACEPGAVGRCADWLPGVSPLGLAM